MNRLLTVVLVVLLVLVAALPAAAIAPAGQVITTAEIDPTGTGMGPTVRAAWQWAAGFQWMKEITPNTANAIPSEGAETEVCVWAIVSDPNGIGDITDVFFKVYHPDNTFKLQVHMQRVTDPTLWEPAKALAVASGQMTVAEEAALDVELTKNYSEMWTACWTYHTHQMSGEYTTYVTPVDQAGNVGTTPIYVTVLPIVVLALDFANVDFGSIVPDAAKWVMGNDIFLSGDGFPTVWNQGNENAYLTVLNSAMVGADFGKLIVDFDVQLLGTKLIYKAGELQTLPGPLEPCTPVQIDFSVHPHDGLPVDSYSGTIDIGIGMIPLDNGPTT